MICAKHTTTSKEVDIMTILMTPQVTGSKLTALTNATSPAEMQTLFINVVHHALVFGNANLERMTKLRDSKAPTAFKAGLVKHMPIKWDKEAQGYKFDADKATNLRLELGVKYEAGTIEETAAVLPELFAKVERQAPKPFELATYLAQVAKRLEKEGITNADDIAGLIAVLANNEDMTAAARTAAFKHMSADESNLQAAV